MSLPDILSDNYDKLSNILTQTPLNPPSNPLHNSCNSHYSTHSAPNNGNKNNLPDDSDDNGNNDSNNNDNDFKRLCYPKISSQVPETPISSYPDRQPASQNLRYRISSITSFLSNSIHSLKKPLCDVCVNTRSILPSSM